MPLLQTSGLTRRFGGLVAVGGVDLTIEPGEVHGLIGPNGAGKTTMLNLISGHLASTGGRISFDGQDVTRAASDRRARLGIRRTFQNLRLFKGMTALENVMVGLHAETRSEIFAGILRTPAQRAEEQSIRERAREALDFVGLLPAADTPAGSLPYGHQRLLEIARSVVARPRLLLLDEPAAGLNGAEGAALVGLIRRISATGTTIALVEHHMEVVMPTCTRITVLNHGRHLADGTPAEIRRDPEVIRAYLGSGTGKRRTQTAAAGTEALRAAG
jgi:branched-chain amino acid transport system ATP-binding protein